MREDGYPGVLSRASETHPLLGATKEQLIVGSLTLLAFILRVWAIGTDGLWYDEAATAMMARATPGEIIRFHWQAAYEHPPLWQLLMHAWSQRFGQSEAALRLLPAIAGTLLIPLLWQFLKFIAQPYFSVRLIATLLVAVSPVLVLYSQESRMYTIVVLLAVASLYASLRLVKAPSVAAAILFVVINWFMTGFHYYSALLLVAEGAFFLLALGANRNLWRTLALSLILSGLPLLLWVSFAPGFRQTFESLVINPVEPELATVNHTWHSFLGRMWKDWTFGNISDFGHVRTQPPHATLGYLLVPLLFIGLWDALFNRHWRIQMDAPRSVLSWGWLVALVFTLPTFFTMFAFQGLQSRYLLFVTPALTLLLTFGILRAWKVARPWGTAGVVLVLLFSIAGLANYFGPYRKSEYREMAAYLTSHLGGSDVILLEAPRQHLLARYYFDPGLEIQPVPNTLLPEYWPVTVAPLDPQQWDDVAQGYVQQYDAIWLVLAGEDEVDPGWFASKYLQATAYQVSCRAWIDVRLCLYLSPEAVSADLVVAPAEARWAEEIQLHAAEVKHIEVANHPHLLVKLDWQSERQPTKDYQVTLRLLDGGGNAVTQIDEFPIGPLLPPTAWGAGDIKAGYMALALPDALTPGTYYLALGLYDSATQAVVPMTSTSSTELLRVAELQVGDDVRLLPVTSSVAQP